jgi:CopG family nickel-responsive transcriptional regulator
LTDIQHRHIAEVISSLHVNLERHHTMEVILVQGQADKLKAIADELITCKGVKTGKLQLSTAVLPPLAR